MGAQSHFNGPETNCGIAYILHITPMNSYDYRSFEQQQFAVRPLSFEGDAKGYSKWPILPKSTVG